jgi:hypothetical protein
MGFLTEMNRLPLIFLSLLNEETGRPGLIIWMIFYGQKGDHFNSIYLNYRNYLVFKGNPCAPKPGEMCRFFERLNGCISQVFLRDAESRTTTPRE